MRLILNMRPVIFIVFLEKNWSLPYYMASFKKSLRGNILGANVFKLIFAIESSQSVCKRNNKTVSLHKMFCTQGGFYQMMVTKYSRGSLAFC